MSTETCSIGDCTKLARSRGWCIAHYTRWLRYGDAAHPQQRGPSNQGETCSIEGCSKPAHQRLLCSMHYTRQRRHGDTNYVTPPDPYQLRLCTISGCDEIRLARGWCASHYQHWRRHGDPVLPRLRVAA